MFQVADYGARDIQPERTRPTSNGGAAYYRIYATRDQRHVALGAIEPKFWKSFCEAASRSEWIARQSEPLPQHALTAISRRSSRRLTLDECVARFASADCCLDPCARSPKRSSPRTSARVASCAAMRLPICRRSSPHASMASHPPRVRLPPQNKKTPALRAGVRLYQSGGGV
jgi:crotonobetainyl-CoA:carnitine CoA-transferase CaiB-like acyl-CoA transferase